MQVVISCLKTFDTQFIGLTFKTCPYLSFLIITHKRIFFFNRQKRAETSACYPEVGCFDTSGPYGYIGMVPNRPEEVIIVYTNYI